MAAPLQRPSSTSTIRTALHARLLDEVEKHALGGQDAGAARAYLEDTLSGYLREYPHLSQAEAQRIIRELCDDIVGYGPLEALLRDPAISDIMVNRYDRVYIQRHGLKAEAGVQFRDEAHLRYVIGRIAEQAGRRIDTTSPLVDARMPQGFRAHAAFPPVALDGACLAIRLFPPSPMTMETLIVHQALSTEMAEYLRLAVRYQSNMLFTGGTGVGKTSLMNACAAALLPDERVLTIEEAAELRLPVSNWIRWETRPANIEGKGEITQTILLRNALRQNPDRIIVGEVRGGEALDMLQAMNTGHRGSMSTLHANSPVHALDRLEVLARWDSGLPGDIVRRLIGGAIEVIVHLERLGSGRHVVGEITEVVGADGDGVRTQSIFRFHRERGVFTWTGVPLRLWDKMRRLGISVPRMETPAVLMP